MFKFKEENKSANIIKVKAELEALKDKIDVLKTMEVGVNFIDSERSMDLSLYSTFENEEDLKAYAIDEEHLKVLSLIKAVIIESKVVDYILK
jgi:hypothetical protein